MTPYHPVKAIIIEYLLQFRIQWLVNALSLIFRPKSVPSVVFRLFGAKNGPTVGMTLSTALSAAAVVKPTLAKILRILKI